MRGFRQRKRASAGDGIEGPSVEKPDPNYPGKGDSKRSLAQSETEVEYEDGSTDGEVREVMANNLELMKDIVMRIREDEEFASNVYANCPRLQHLLDDHPDLRPVFEDPELVRINFEQVYRDAGGVLPEDKPKKRSWLSIIVNHPLFKILRLLLVVKKILNCVMGGGFAMIKGCFMGLCVDEAAEVLGDGMDADGGGDDAGGDGDNGDVGNPENQANKERLYAAADHMEDPEVQEKMTEILSMDDPDQLADAIENDPELKALRDSNALCAELMSDPDTMRVLTDPDNLRALGEAPDLIEADFADPDWTPPDDIETGSGRGLDTVAEVDFDADGDVEPDGEGDGEFDEENPEEEEMDLEDEDEEGPEYEMGDSDNNAGGKGQKKKNQNQNNNDNGGGGAGGGFLSQVGAGLTDMVAAELVGFGVGDITGGGDEFGALEDIEDVPAEDVADGAAAGAENADAAAAAAELFTSDGMDNLEDGMDGLEDGLEDNDNKGGDSGDGDGDNRNAERARAAGIGAGAGLAAYGVGQALPNKKKGEEGDNDDEEEGKKSRALDDDATQAEEDEEEDKPKKKNRFGFVGGFASTMVTAAKEHVATALLGDDFGEALVERQEEGKDSDDEDDKKKEKKEKKGRRKMFGKKR